MDSHGTPGIQRVMIAYWLLFLIFAVAALRFATMGPVTAAAGPRDPRDLSPAQQQAYRNRAFTLMALIPALMIGFRYDVGTDFGAYSEMFDEISRSDLGRAMIRIDPGYAFINWVLGKLGIGFWGVNLVCGLLFMFGMVRFARVLPSPWLAIAVAIPYLIIGVGMGYSRQAIAIGLSMAGLAALSKGSFLRFVIWVLIGALFHRTAVILIPIAAIAYSRNRFQTVIIGLVGCVLGYYVLTTGQGLEHFQRAYVSSARESSGAGIRLAMNLPPALLFLFFSRRFAIHESERRTWRNLSLIAIASFVAWVLISQTTALDRMALYIIPLQIFVLASIPSALSPTRSPSMMLIVAILAYSAAVQFVWLNYSTNAIHWVPYKIYGLG